MKSRREFLAAAAGVVATPVVLTAAVDKGRAPPAFPRFTSLIYWQHRGRWWHDPCPSSVKPGAVVLVASVGDHYVSRFDYRRAKRWYELGKRRIYWTLEDVERAPLALPSMFLRDSILEPNRPLMVTQVATTQLGADVCATHYFDYCDKPTKAVLTLSEE